MKHLILILAISCIAVVCNAEPVPEATNLDAELYTLRLVVASGDSGIFKKSDGPSSFEWKSSETNEQVQYIAGTNAPAIFTPHKNPIVSQIEQADATYTEFASVHLKLGEEFSATNALVKGSAKLSDETGSLMTGILTECELSPQTNSETVSLSVEFNYEGVPIKLDNLQLQIGQWCCLVLGAREKNEVMLIQIYEPTK